MFKRMSKKGLGLALISVLLVGALAGCGKSDKGAADSSASPNASAGTEISGKVSASGSTALQPIVGMAAEKFMSKNSKVTVSVTGGGSGTGVKNVADGVSDIGNSDVVAAAEYKDKLVDHVVCIAPFALIVNNDVNVDSITKQQAADIYAGKIKNWKDIGGKDLPIALIHRQDGSGSKKLVQQIIMGDTQFAKEGATQDASQTVATAVGQQSGAIGYVDVPYITSSVKALKLDGVEYSKDNIKSGKYPLYGTEHMYTKGEPTGAVKAFLDYVMSSEFLNDPEVAKKGMLPADLLK